MPGIIRQKDDLPALPDFRNLGTVLRILLIVNGAGLVVAFAREPRFEALAGEWATITGFIEPHLLAELALLWILQPILARLRYEQGIAVIAVITVVTAAVMHLVVTRMLPVADASLLRHLVFALGTQLLLIVYFRLRAKALSPAITEARLQALQARIRPHFLFNSINAVLSLVRNEPQRAETALEDMADLFRVLMRDNRDLAPLEDEVELCRQYLDLEKLRLGERLVVDWNVKSMPGDALVPPLVLQPLLENAVYHGIEPSSTPGTVSINIFASRDGVHAILKNPYAADRGNHHAGNKMALNNVRERLALHFDAEASLDSRVTRDGYEVHIRMPYRVRSDPSAALAAKPATPRRANGASASPTKRASQIDHAPTTGLNLEAGLG
jgi:two-component system sensor histidine kinase AlgZ